MTMPAFWLLTMRKIDYTILAHIIRDEIRDAREQRDDYTPIRVDCASRIGRNFASRAHVDRDKFLSECNINGSEK